MIESRVARGTLPAHGHATAWQIRVIDGDTFACDIQLGFELVLAGQAVRLAGFDAWENSRHRRTIEVTDEELRRGAIAKLALAEILNGASVVEVIDALGRDPYGRRLCWVYADGRDVAETMRAGGHERKAG